MNFKQMIRIAADWAAHRHGLHETEARVIESKVAGSYRYHGELKSVLTQDDINWCADAYASSIAHMNAAEGQTNDISHNTTGEFRFQDLMPE